MAKEIVWTHRAVQKYDKIIQYLEEEWGEGVTRSLVQKTHDILDLISDHSELGTLENPEKKIRGFLLTKHNRLFYRVTEREVILLNFFDTRSGPKRKRY